MSNALAVSFLESSILSETQSVIEDASSARQLSQSVTSVERSRLTASVSSEPGGDQSSLGFICTVCSTMMGSTLMTLPWAFENAGLVAALIMITVVGVVSYYTCFIILKWGSYPNGRAQDFSALCSRHVGPWAGNMANLTSIAVCVGVLAVYHVLMASCLNNVTKSIGELAGVNVTFLCCGTGNFRYLVSAAVVALLVLPMLLFVPFAGLMRVGSYGSVSVLYNAGFIVSSALYNWPSAAERSGRKVREAGDLKDFGVFFGTLGLSLFIHNLLLQMARSHSCSLTKPSVVKRDIGIAYALAMVFYIAVGAVPAVAYELGSSQYKFLVENHGQLELPQNILLSYSHDSWGAIIGQLLLMLQILVVYPIIGTLVRRQYFKFTTGNDNWGGRSTASLFIVVLVSFTTLVAAVYPKPGNVVGYVGVYTAIVYMLGLPILVHIKAKQAENPDKSSSVSTVLHALIFTVMSLAFLLQFLP